MTPKTVLIVDDEIELREILEFDFETAGFNVLSAGNGSEALKLLESQTVEALVSDIRMPIFDGVQLLTEVRKRNYPVAMVFISGFSDITPQAAYDKGIQGMFVKPFDRRGLVTTIERLLEPMTKRWTHQKDFKAEKQINITFSDFNTALKDKSLNVGRGGLYLNVPDLAVTPGINVSFNIVFKNAIPQSISGGGIVRWARSSEVGIEFEFLSEPTLEFILNHIKESKSVAYIPQN